MTVASSSRSVAVSSIKYAKAIVSGEGIEKGKEPASSLVSIKDGKYSSSDGSVLRIDGIPSGNNRIVTVYAYTSETELIDENLIVLRALCDVVSKENTVTVDKKSTPLGNVFYYLNELAYPISRISSLDKNGIVSKIDSSVDSEKINAAQIAYDYKKGGLNALKDSSEYIAGAKEGGEATSIVLYAKDYKYIWYWEDGEGGKLLEMTADSEKGSGWYTATLNYTSINLLFKTQSDWNGEQTANLTRSAGTWTYENGEWSGSAVNDDVPPVVSWISPEAGDELSGYAYLFVSASDDESGISKIEYYDGENLLGSTEGISVYKIDTSVMTNGSHVLSAKVYDGAGNCTESAGLELTTKNENIPPCALITTGNEGTAEVAKSFSAASSYDKNGTIFLLC